MKRIELLSIQVGLPQAVTGREAIDGPDQPVWTTAFFKQPVKGKVWVGKTNIAGDGQASVKTHGGPDKAVCVYPWEHYSHWQRELDLPELKYGALGENFTSSGQTEDQCCIGDVIRIEDVVLQVSQPRPPCWRLSRWWQRKDFAARMEQTGLTGWYCRVIEEGYVEDGAEVELLERTHPEWTVLRANSLLYGSSAPFEQVEAVEKSEGVKQNHAVDQILEVEQIDALASCNVLADSWRELLLKRKAGIVSERWSRAH
jgi:MOSC domain-containing protein YiiM